MGFVQFLESFQTVFLPNPFSPLFARTDVTFSVLQTEHDDIMTCKNLNKNLKFNRKCSIQCIDSQRKLTKHKITEDSCKNCETSVSHQCGIKLSLPYASPLNQGKIRTWKMYQFNKILYYSIFVNLAGHINAIFLFGKLLKPRKFELFSGTNKFPEYLIILLKKLYPRVINFQGSKNELTVFYRTVFKGKSPAKLLQ